MFCGTVLLTMSLCRELGRRTPDVPEAPSLAKRSPLWQFTGWHLIVFNRLPCIQAVAKMQNTDVLCSSCQKIFSSTLSGESWSLHHTTLRELRDAIAQRCYVCTVLWDTLSVKHQQAWTHQSAMWRPLQYRAYQTKDQEAIIRLEILFLDADHDRISCMKYRIISTEDSAFTDMFPLQSLENQTSSVSTLRLLRKWCGVCSTSHVRCNQIAAGKRVYPTRVLEISLDETDTEWKLHVPTCDKVSVQPYITLSYRWGSEPNLVLLTSNIEEFRLGKPIRDLPQTYKDLITVARSLSVRYIWIDALCILQDSAEDWEVESFNMQHVYANAFCNIAASASRDPNGGLFRTRDPSAVRPGQIAASFSAPTLKLYHIFDKSYPQRQVLNGPLHNRGWVFQERLLAPRVIHFARNQIYWECFTQSKCEAFPAGIPFHSTLKDFDCLWELKEEQSSRSSVHLFNTWNGLVKEYTKCALTKQSDKLVAIAGLASLFHERSNDQYIAGLWRAHLAEYLDWRVYEPIMKTGTDYRAPSWSWAAVDGPVHPQGCSASTKMHITIEDVHVENSGSSMLGATANGYLRLHGIIIDATVHAQIDSELHKISTQECDMHVQMFPDHLGIAFEEKSIHCLVLKTEPEHSMRSDGTVQSVSNAVVFLVLEVQCSTSCVYKRIGHFVVRDGVTLNKLAIIASEDGSVQSMNGSQRSTIVLI